VKLCPHQLLVALPALWGRPERNVRQPPDVPDGIVNEPQPLVRRLDRFLHRVSPALVVAEVHAQTLAFFVPDILPPVDERHERATVSVPCVAFGDFDARGELGLISFEQFLVIVGPRTGTAQEVINPARFFAEPTGTVGTEPGRDTSRVPTGIVDVPPEGEHLSEDGIDPAVHRRPRTVPPLDGGVVGDLGGIIERPRLVPEDQQRAFQFLHPGDRHFQQVELSFFPVLVVVPAFIGHHDNDDVPGEFACVPRELVQHAVDAVEVVFLARRIDADAGDGVTDLRHLAGGALEQDVEILAVAAHGCHDPPRLSRIGEVDAQALVELVHLLTHDLLVVLHGLGLVEEPDRETSVLPAGPAAQVGDRR